MIRFCLIYRILFPDGRVYIGQTNDYARRKQQHIREAMHRRGRCYVWHRKRDKAIRKFGKDNLVWKVLKAGIHPNDVRKEEDRFMLRYDSVANGYNDNLNAHRPKNRKRRPIATRALSQSEFEKMEAQFRNGRIVECPILAAQRAYAAEMVERKAREGKPVESLVDMIRRQAAERRLAG